MQVATKITEAKFPLKITLAKKKNIEYEDMLNISREIMERQPSDNHLLFYYGWSLIDTLYGLYEGSLKCNLINDIER